MSIGCNLNIGLDSGGGVITFSPLALSPALWLKADADTFQTVDGSAASANDDPVGSVLDQSGNALHFSQATAEKRFVLKTNVQNGNPAIRSDGLSDILATPSFVLSQPLTIYAVVRRLNNSEGRIFDGKGLQGEAVLRSSDAFAYCLNAPSTACESDGAVSRFDVFAVVLNGASSLLECGTRATVTGNPGALGISAGMVVGGAGQDAGFYFNGDLAELIAYSGAHSLATRNLFRTYFQSAARWKGIPQVRCAGDSLTTGTGATAGNDYPSLLQVLLGAGYEVTNSGSGGAAVADMATAARVDHGRHISGLERTYGVLWGGTNDIHGSATGAQAYASNQSWWSTIRTATGKVIALTMLKRGNFDASMETERQAFNALVLGDDTLYDAVVDVAARAEFQDTNDTDYFGDGVHLTDAGYAVVAEMVHDAIAEIG
jgi:lysophospholipase L1-like esterase